MDFCIDDSLVDLGIQTVALGIVRNLDVTVPLSPEFLKRIAYQEERVSGLDLEMLRENRVIKGYRDMVSEVGRSLKKYPPAAEALIKNTQRRQKMPRVNSIVDIYNLEALTSYLSIGAHDLDKIEFPVTFTVAKEKKLFYPIMSNEKEVSTTDFIYEDQEKVLGYLGCRDSELCKIDETTKNALFIIQGNRMTTIEERVDALKRIMTDLKAHQPEMTYQIKIIESI